MKHLIPFLLFLFGLNTFAQSETELALQLLDPDIIADATLERDEFIEWVGKTTDALDPIMQSIDGKVSVLITFNFTREGVQHQAAAAPEIPAQKLEEIAAAIQKVGTINIKYVDYSMIILYAINGGAEEDNPQYTPAIDLPYENKMQAFKKMSLQNKVTNFENWMEEEVIPMVASFETKVDDVFKGVRDVGMLLESKNYKDDPIGKTSKMCSYWRGMLEMEQWNQLILLSKMCVLYATGEHERADRLLNIISMFSDENTLAAALYDEIGDKRAIIVEEHNKMINDGIALHDKGDFDGAIAQYKEVLKILPRSAWATYELYFSESAKVGDIEDQVSLWQNNYRAKVYDRDPIYHLDVRASTGTEAYLLYRRNETLSLFKKKDDIKKDLLTYADIAFELGVYDFAGELYWLIYSHLPKDEFKDRNILASFLYCMEKLGCGELKVNFKGNFEKEFKKIDKFHQKQMEESTWYNSMRNK